MGGPAGDAMRFETAAVHVGQDPEPVYGSVNVPIYQTSTYAQERVGEPKVWDYARGGNPTRAAFETALGGSLRPRYAVGSSVLRQISVSMGPTWMTAAWIPDPARSSHRPSVKPVRANFDAA